MKYGEQLWKPRWYLGRRYFAYNFRSGPVPFIQKSGRGWFKHYYKTPRVAQEKRLSFADDAEYVRKKRNMRNLPDPWDDYPRADVRNKKSWKKSFKCRKQWSKHVKKNCQGCGR